MAQLTYTVIMSLDGFVADSDGSFDWAFPDEEVHDFVNDLSRPVGTHLLGRRMYQLMAAWETDPELADHSAQTSDFASLWQGADKVVWSSTMPEPITRRTTIQRSFDADQISRLKAKATAELGIGGPTLAAAALRAGLVDEIRTITSPVTVGSGLRAFPQDLRIDMTLLEHRSFDGRGMTFARYAVAPRG